MKFHSVLKTRWIIAFGSRNTTRLCYEHTQQYDQHKIQYVYEIEFQPNSDEREILPDIAANRWLKTFRLKFNNVIEIDMCLFSRACL